MILGGDIVLSVNDVPVESDKSYDEIYASIARLKTGENLSLTIFREGHVVKLSIPTSQ